MSGYLKRFFIGGLSLSSIRVSQKIVSFLLLPVFTYYLNPKEFGIIAIFSLIMSMLALVYNPGLISSTQRLYYDYSPESTEIKELIASSWWFLIVVPVVVIMFSIFFGEKVCSVIFKEFEFWPYGFLAVLSATMIQPIRLWSSIWVCRDKTKSVAILSLIKLLVGVIFSLLFVVILKLGVLGRIYGLITGNFLLFIVAFYCIVRFAGFRFSFKSISNTLWLGLPLVFSVFSYIILDISDRYMIEKIVGLSELGIYDIGYTISSAPLVIIVGFNAVWQPIFFENMNLGDHKSISRLTNYYIMGFALVCGAVIIFSNEIFNILINREYIIAIEIIPWVVCGIFLLGSSNFMNSILGYNKKFLEIGLISLGAAILNVCLNIFLIKLLGIIGAAISTCISYFVYFLILFIRTKKPIKKIFNLNKLLIPNIALLLIVMIFIMINMLYKNFSVYSLIGKTLIMTFLLFALFYSNYFSTREKKSFVDFIKKTIRLRPYAEG